MNANFQARRQPRKSMLGTHRARGYSIQLLAEPTPKSTKTNSYSNGIFTMNVSSLSFRPPRKSMLGTHSKRRASPPVFKETSPPVLKMRSPLKMKSPEIVSPPNIFINSPPNVERSPPKKNLETLFADSFEEHESMMMANENEESLLATTLNGVNDDEESILATTLIEINKNEESVLGTTLTAINEHEDSHLSDTIVNDTIVDAVDKTTPNVSTTVNTKPEVINNTLNDVLKLLNLMIEKNNQSVLCYDKQIKDLKKQMDDTNLQTEEIKRMKCRLIENYNLKDLSSELEQAEKKTFRSPNSLETDSTVRHNFKSPCVGPSPSKQIIKEIRSTIKFLKTPRMSRAPRSSVLLTPHSMSFCIKSQYEKLLLE